MDMQKEASKNLRALSDNPYPGRGFVIGMTPDGEHLVQVYWLMGRSEDSRNRRFAEYLGLVRSEAVDPSKIENPALLFYNAMREYQGCHYVVTNGDQTDTIFDKLGGPPYFFERAMHAREYEEDPHCTSRISAICSRYQSGVDFKIALLSRSKSDTCDRAFYYFDPPAGLGYCMHTYQGDGNPLPPFLGRPFVLPIGSGIEEVSTFYWDALNAENRVALVTKFIDIVSGVSRVHIINRY